MTPEEEMDLLTGLPAIAAYLRIKPRRVQHLMVTGGLPTFTLGGRIVSARKSSLRAWLADCEAKARADRAQP